MTRTNRWFATWLGAAVVLAAALPTLAHGRAMGVEVWTDRGDDAVYKPGEAMQVKVRASDDAYMLVYEIDSEGKVTVLYPWRRATGRVEGHRTYRLPPEDSRFELNVEAATGQGFIVAIASSEPFRDLPWYLRPFDPQAESVGYEDRHDEEEGFDRDGRVVGDAMVAMERIRRRVLGHPSDVDRFATAYASYYVGHEVRYPRYLCADCHRPDHWAWWDGFDPYYSQCSVFDFRVNWNWGWGPQCWTGYVPYYFYVVRPDCPPRYWTWYNNHTRWSSWDGWKSWNNLWGGQLTRYKGPPPQGYSPPPSKSPWSPGSSPVPPGYISSSGAIKRSGVSEPLPVGRNRPSNGDEGQGSRGTWRTPTRGDWPRQHPDREPVQPAPPSEGGGWRIHSEKPQVRPEPPREERPRDEPRYEPPHREPAQHAPAHKESPPPAPKPSAGHGPAKKDDGGNH